MPLALKVFLTTLAIVDDLGAIVAIAIFFTSDLSPVALGLGAVFIVGPERRRRAPIASHPLLGALLWVSALKSGVHATLTGIVLALFIPPKSVGEPDENRPAIRLEHVIKPWSAWLIIPACRWAARRWRASPLPCRSASWRDCSSANWSASCWARAC